jgi:hypothetical protein
VNDAELIAQLEMVCENARQRIAKDCGQPFVLTVEGLGYRIVPAWVVDMLARVIEKGSGSTHPLPKEK